MLRSLNVGLISRKMKLAHSFLVILVPTHTKQKALQPQKRISPKRPTTDLHYTLSSAQNQLLKSLCHFLEARVPGMVSHFPSDLGGKLELMTQPFWHR